MYPLPQGLCQELSMDFYGPFPNGDNLLVVTGIQKWRSWGQHQQSSDSTSWHFLCQARKLKEVGTTVIEGKNWRQELFTFLRQYRATPHSTTGTSPSELLNGRKLKSTLPRLQHDQAPPEVRQTDAKRKEEMKEYANNCSRAKRTDLTVGDKVLIKQPKQNKMSTPFKPEPLEIKDIRKEAWLQPQTQNALSPEMHHSSKSFLPAYDQKEQAECLNISRPMHVTWTLFGLIV